MKAIVTVANLIEALTHATRATSTRNSVQVLGGLRFEVGDELKITGTDMETVISAFAGVGKGSKPGVAVAGPAKEILRSIKTLPKTETVELAVVKGKGTKSDPGIFVVTCGRTTLRFDLYVTEDYPSLPTSDRLVAVLGAGHLVRAFEYVRKCYGRDIDRPVLCGVQVELEKGVLRLVATDSYRLAHAQVEYGGEAVETFIVQGAALEEVVRLAKATDMIYVHLSATHAFFHGAGATVTARLIDGKYPNWRQLVPDGFETDVRLDHAQALESVKRVSALIGTAAPLKLSTSPGSDTTRITVEREGKIVVEERVDGATTGRDPVEAGFNAGFLADAIESVDAEEVRLRLINPLRPMVIDNPDEPSDWTLLMPIRLAY